MAPLFPAIFIGGPPNSGKSTLLYRLSQALRNNGVQHYALRASPDGEGDWSHEAPLALVRELRTRARGAWSVEFAAWLSQQIDRRHLPLLVDVGGRVSPESTLIASTCTHAILIAQEWAALDPWRTMLRHEGRPLIAELQSELAGNDQIIEEQPVLRGTISGLGRGLETGEVCFAALVRLLKRHMSYSPDQLYHSHRNLTNVELVLHLERAIYPLPAHNQEQRWQPEELPALLESLPETEPLALYGRAPVWVIGAIAGYSRPSPQIFNAIGGWLVPPPLQVAEVPDPERLTWFIEPVDESTIRIKFDIPGNYLDYNADTALAIPRLPADAGVLLDGKLPTWLYAALVRMYCDHAAWIAIRRPQINDFVIVWSQNTSRPVGGTVGE